MRKESYVRRGGGEVTMNGGEVTKSIGQGKAHTMLSKVVSAKVLSQKDPTKGRLIASDRLLHCLERTVAIVITRGPD